MSASERNSGLLYNFRETFGGCGLLGQRAGQLEACNLMVMSNGDQTEVISQRGASRDVRSQAKEKMAEAGPELKSCRQNR